MAVEDEEDWHEKIQTKHNEKITVDERRLKRLSVMTGYSQSKIKEKEEHLKLSGHLLE